MTVLGQGCGASLACSAQQQQLQYQFRSMSKPSKKSAFLVKTYDILSTPQHSQIVEWHHDGIGFVINNIDRFTEEILPVYFKHSNFASFIRQLNMYGFSKKRAAKSENYYHHPSFRRDDRELLGAIHRKVEKKIHKNQSRAQHPPQDHQIVSQLSIQLEQLNDNPKNQQPEDLLLQGQLSKLSQANFTLIGSQLQVALNILDDINLLGPQAFPSHDRERVSQLLTDYIECHYAYHNLYRQKASGVLHAVKEAAESRIKTQQTLSKAQQALSKSQQERISQQYKM